MAGRVNAVVHPALIHTGNGAHSGNLAHVAASGERRAHRRPSIRIVAALFRLCEGGYS